MKRILTLKNISAAPITINGVLLAINEFYYPDFGWWMTNDYKNYYESNRVSISLVDGTQLTYAANTTEFTGYFIYTVRYVKEHIDVLTEIFPLKGQVTTTNANSTKLFEYNYPNGRHKPIIYIDGYEDATGNTYTGRSYPNIRVRNNVATFVGSFNSDAQLNNLGFNTGSGFGIFGIVASNKLVINVVGRNGATILWTVELVKKG